MTGNKIFSRAHAHARIATNADTFAKRGDVWVSERDRREMERPLSVATVLNAKPQKASPKPSFRETRKSETPEQRASRLAGEARKFMAARHGKSRTVAPAPTAPVQGTGPVPAWFAERNARLSEMACKSRVPAEPTSYPAPKPTINIGVSETKLRADYLKNIEQLEKMLADARSHLETL